MPPIRLELLQARDDAEWRRAWQEWGLWQFACTVAACYLNRWPQYIEDVASKALIELVDAVPRIPDEPGIEERLEGLVKGDLKRLTRWRSWNFLERQWPHAEQPFPEDDRPEGHRGKLDVGGFLANVFRVEAYYEVAIHEFAEMAGLDSLEMALLKEHVAEGHTQEEFANRHGIPLGGVGNLLREVLNKVRRAFEGDERRMEGGEPLGVRGGARQRANRLSESDRASRSEAPNVQNRGSKKFKVGRKRQQKKQSKNSQRKSSSRPD